jgi:hypothetical protein
MRLLTGTLGAETLGVGDVTLIVTPLWKAALVGMNVVMNITECITNHTNATSGAVMFDSNAFER